MSGLDFKRYDSVMGTIARIPAVAINLKARGLTQLIPLVLIVGVLASGEMLTASTKPVTSRHGMVVAAEPLATAVGLQVLRDGGSAIDAAVATAFAMAVTYPQAGNLGGGGFIIFIVDPLMKMNLINRLNSLGGRVINFHFTDLGSVAWRIK